MGKAKTPPTRKKPARARSGAGASTRAAGAGGAATPGPGSLGHAVSLEELIRQQGVKPINDLNELAGMWPEDFDPDEFLKWLEVERAARRQVAREKGRG